MRFVTSFNKLSGVRISDVGTRSAASLFNVVREPVYDSSYLSSIGYDYDNDVMEVEFTDGAIYQYKCPDSEVVDIFDADSRGQWFYYNIRTSYPFRKIRDRFDY